MSAGRTRNRLLRQLAKSDPDVYARVFDDLEPVSLNRRAQLGAAHERAEWAYFLESGIVSLVGATSSGHSVEVAFVGNEGVAGIPDVLGARSMPYSLIVQLPGLAYRLPTSVAREHVFSCTALHELLMAHAQFLIHQLTQSAICNRFHTAVQRLSRWLLLTADRAGTDRLELTHEFVAQMVGAPRSAVTQAASVLRNRGMINYERGLIIIRNSKSLHKTACECFDAVSSIVDGNGNVAPGFNSHRVPAARRRTKSGSRQLR
jgi:CRP-like cAMP-binding protein